MFPLARTPPPAAAAAPAGARRHILAGTIKDTVTRYATQTGHFVSRRAGWDCHGLPVEFEIDKTLNITSRDQVRRPFSPVPRRLACSHSGPPEPGELVLVF